MSMGEKVTAGETGRSLMRTAFFHIVVSKDSGLVEDKQTWKLSRKKTQLLYQGLKARSRREREVLDRAFMEFQSETGISLERRFYEQTTGVRDRIKIAEAVFDAMHTFLKSRHPDAYPILLDIVKRAS
jgi:hypothetical protein